MTDASGRVFETLDNLQGPLARLRRSLAKTGTCFPLLAVDAASDAVDEIDQFLQRYQQVVDVTLRKLFPRIAETVSGTAPPRFFRDVLDALERAEVIDDAGWWVEINSQRNRLVHEYAMEPQVRLAELNAAWEAAPLVLQNIDRIRVLAEKLW